jgi:hypothetical protein
MNAAWMNVLIGLQAFQVLFLALHDWVPLGRLSNLTAVRGGKSRLATVGRDVGKHGPICGGACGDGVLLLHTRDISWMGAVVGVDQLRFAVCWGIAGVVDSVLFWDDAGENGAGQGNVRGHLCVFAGEARSAARYIARDFARGDGGDAGGAGDSFEVSGAKEQRRLKTAKAARSRPADETGLYRRRQRRARLHFSDCEVDPAANV